MLHEVMEAQGAREEPEDMIRQRMAMKVIHKPRRPGIRFHPGDEANERGVVEMMG